MNSLPGKELRKMVSPFAESANAKSTLKPQKSCFDAMIGGQGMSRNVKGAHVIGLGSSEHAAVFLDWCFSASLASGLLSLNLR